jgi:hypothetical protein
MAIRAARCHWEYTMKIRIVLWSLFMAVAGFMLATSTPPIPSLMLLGSIAGAATGVALGIMFTYRARRRQGFSGTAEDQSKPLPKRFAA